MANIGVRTSQRAMAAVSGREPVDHNHWRVHQGCLDRRGSARDNRQVRRTQGVVGRVFHDTYRHVGSKISRNLGLGAYPEQAPARTEQDGPSELDGKPA